MRLSADRPVVDVRTSAEFHAGHIPNAVNLPLFSNDERALIGTTYAEAGRQEATRVGMDLVGPRMNEMIDDLKAVVPTGPVLVHCWRGGMRSESVAWLLNFSGEFEASILRGGYKAFRQFALREFSRERKLTILGGMTGSGKTHILQGLQARGEQVIDLEGLANHKGSAFGSIGLDNQPTQQQFENELGVALSRTDPERRLWLEDESRRIGRCMLPEGLWVGMRTSSCIFVDRSMEERCAHLVADYGMADRDALVDAISRIERRLGGVRTQEAIEFVRAGEMAGACEILLGYYDKTYAYGLGQREESNVHRLPAEGLSTEDLSANLIPFADRIEAARVASDPAGR